VICLNIIKGIALDVDGVLTDGTFYWGPEGQEFKQFSFHDIMGISLGTKAGLVFALISGEDSPLIDRFAMKMRIVDIHKGCKNKAKALSAFCKKYDFHFSQVCFMGDDVNDLPALALAGLSAAPQNAHASVKKQVMLITEQSGGQGALRELVDHVLENNLKDRDETF
jgi:3-deoxy-D-manno-octulosonate 8-phosphate phosphatase (KDO 8-P phosphatase)